MKPRLIGLALVVAALVLAGCGTSDSTPTLPHRARNTGEMSLTELEELAGPRHPKEEEAEEDRRRQMAEQAELEDAMRP